MSFMPGQGAVKIKPNSKGGFTKKAKTQPLEEYDYEEEVNY